MTIDSHCHIHDEKFAGDVHEVLQRARLNKVTHLVTIGCDIETTKRAQHFAKSFDYIYFTAGFHPHEAKLLDDGAFSELSALARDPKCVAIGECGLDYYYLHSSKEEQRAAFIKQLLLARELDQSVVVHLRDAFDDCIEILKDFEDLMPRTVIHCFSGTLDEAKTFFKLGCLVSLSGIITFKKPGDLPEVARIAPLDNLLVETDCPYLAPHPYRGQRNEPAYIVFTLEAIARARGEEVAVIDAAIRNNSLRFFRIKE